VEHRLNPSVVIADQVKKEQSPLNCFDFSRNITKPNDDH
jgi:hypothetical protein